MARNKYPEVTVERILDAAQKLFLEKGYDHTTIQDIVDELGDTKDEEWKEKEVARLKAEQGIAEFEQPTLNTKLGNFEIGGVVDEQTDNRNNHEPSVSDEP